MTQKQLRTLNAFVEHYGVYNQENKAIEECKELIAEIELAKQNTGFVENIVDEIADVEIMINQLKIIFRCFAEVEERIDFKINRQLERIEKGE